LIDTLGFSSQFEPERRNDEGKVISEAQCNYYGSFKGRIKIHEIHARKTIETISISDSSSAYRLSNNPQCSISRNLKYALAKKALAYSVHSSRNRLKNFFSSIGYIVDKRIKDDESIFEITLGKFHNINKGDIVDIYTKTEKEKSLENEIVIREIKVAQGKVTDYIEDSYSWIIVPDQEQASRVRLGDYVKIRYKQSIWDSTKQMFN
jgi:hypothetical protein